MTLQIVKVAVALQLKLSAATIEQHSAASPYIVGKELADYVYRYAHQKKLGYFPPLEYFRSQGELDGELLDATENIAWLVSNMSREELQMRLRAAFSSIRFESIQNLSFTMPKVRPGDVNDLHNLANHYTPDHVKVNMVVSLVKKTVDDSVLAEYVSSVIHRWLDENFVLVDIKSVQCIE